MIVFHEMMSFDYVCVNCAKDRTWRINNPINNILDQLPLISIVNIYIYAYPQSLQANFLMRMSAPLLYTLTLIFLSWIMFFPSNWDSVDL